MKTRLLSPCKWAGPRALYHWSAIPNSVLSAVLLNRGVYGHVEAGNGAALAGIEGTPSRSVCEDDGGDLHPAERAYTMHRHVESGQTWAPRLVEELECLRDFG